MSKNSKYQLKEKVDRIFTGQNMDSSSPQQMEQLCQEYDGFYKFAKMLEHLAQGIADGVITVPTP